VDRAIPCLCKAIALDRKVVGFQVALGLALKDVGRLDEAISCFEEAIARAPQNADAHNGLGAALVARGRLREAIAYFEKAIKLDPKHARSHGNLGRARRLAAAEDKLPALLRGDFEPTSNDQRLALAELCASGKHYRVSARLYADAFAAEPKLADDLKPPYHRYNAACSAALAASGQQGEEDAARLDDREKARLRRQALGWLRANLALRAKQLEGGRPADRAEVRRALAHWRKDPDLAGLRDEAALGGLPAEEREAFTRLWADVAALLKKAEGKTK
jgi:tetratricopeptide (TPR) repeat protein